MDTSIPMGASESEYVGTHVHKHKHKHHHKEGESMLGSVGGTPVITGGDGSGMGLGAGLGGGLLGGILGGALLGNRGLFGGTGNVEGVVTPSMLTAGLAGVTSSSQNDAVMSTLGAIQGAIPLAEGQTQLAIQTAQDDITSQNQAQTLALTQLAFNGQLASAAGFSSTKDSVDSLSTQVAIGQGVTNTNIERLGWQITTAINADGQATRALITSNETARLNQQLTNAQNEIIELRNEGRRRDDRNAVEVTMINNQNQNQLQFQQQQQTLNGLLGCINGLAQNIQATNQAINIGGFQQANPTNTNTNVRA